MVREAVWVPNDPVRLVRVEDGVEILGDPGYRSFWSGEPPGAFVPELLWKAAGLPPGVPVSGVRDDNRSALLPNRHHTIRGQEFIAAVKGCGAAMDAYENVALTADRVRAIAHDPDAARALASEDGA